MVYNDNTSGPTGYINTDINYDVFSELYDFFIFNNSIPHTSE